MTFDLHQRRAYKAERAFDIDTSTTNVQKFYRSGPSPLWHQHEIGRATFGGAFLVRLEPDRRAVEARLNQLVDLIVATDWWQEVDGRRKHVKMGRPAVTRSESGNAYAIRRRGQAVIAFPKYASLNTAVVVAHELAHHVGGLGDDAHGGRWAGAFVHLVDMVLGPWYGHLLAGHFHEKGVPVDLEAWPVPDRLTMPLYDVVAVEHGLTPVSTAGERAASRKAARDALPLGAEDFEQPTLFAATA